MQFIHVITDETGNQFALALTREGNVFWWGQLGDVHAGGQRATLKSTDGQIATTERETGQSHSVKQSSLPDLIDMDDRIHSIACGDKHALLLGQKLHGVGNAAGGCLGIPGNNSYVQPIEIPMEDVSKSGIDFIACGPGSSALM